MAKKITLRNNTATNTGKGSKMTHAEMDANLETFYMSSSLDGTTLYLYSTGSANVDSIDLSGLGGAGAQGIQGIQGSAGTGTQGIQGLAGTGVQGTQGLTGTGTQGIQGLAGTGIQGTDGSQGIQGIAGGAASQGIQGVQGLTGIQGTDGAQGIQGPASAGSQGIQGIQGPAAVGSQGTVIAPFAFASVNTTANGSGEGISWSNWDSQNSTLDFTFTTPQANTDYTVVTDSEVFDNYFVGISNKTVNGFTAEFYDDTQSRTPSTFAEFTFLVYASTPLAITGVGAQGITGIQGAQGPTGTGVQGTQGIQGTQGDAGITSGRIYYFNNSQVELGMYRLTDTPSTSGQTNELLNAAANTTDQVIASYITPELGFTIIPQGVQRFHLHFTKDAQNDDIEVFVRLTHTDDQGNIIQTIGTSPAVNVGWNNNNQTPVEVELDIVLPTATIASTDRMKVDIYVNNNENQIIPVTLYSEGSTYYSYVTTTVGASQGQDGAQGTQGIQGLKGAQGTQGIQGLKGAQGTQGIQGLKGAQGIQGIQGLKGAQGTQGIQGTNGIAEADFYDYPDLASGGVQGVNVLGKVVAGSTVITTGHSEVQVSIGEIGNLTLGEQVHITATGWGASSIALNVSVQDPGGATALPTVLNQSGDIVFKVDQNVDGTVFIMYHVWYTTDTFPG